MKKLYISALIVAATLFLDSCQFGDTIETYINIEVTEELLNKEKKIRSYSTNDLIGDIDLVTNLILEIKR